MKTKLVPNRNTAAERRASFTRRHFLRGLGACMALPAFESLSPMKLLAGPAGAAGAGAKAGPVRMAFLYVPNGTIPSAWWPASEGKDYELPRSLQPLAKVRHQLQVIS